MKLISYNKNIMESSNLRDMYRYALKKGNHYYSKEYVDIVNDKIYELNINKIYEDMKYIYGDMTLENFESNKCACCGKEKELSKANINNLYEIYLCKECRNLTKSPNEIYIVDFLKNVSSLYELIQFTTNNEILLSTSRHISKDVVVVDTKLGKISADIESKIFYVHKRV